MRGVRRMLWCLGPSLAAGVACGSGGGDRPGPDGALPVVADASGVAADGSANADAAATADGAAAPHRIVFVSSTRHAGDLGGLAGGDGICADRAAEAGLDGEFKAWLSSTDATAHDRLSHPPVPYVRTDGAHVADDFADLVSGSLGAPIDHDEDGSAVRGDVWTGTLDDGAAAGSTCGGFATTAGRGVCGDSGATDGSWTDSFEPACTTPLRLYCVQQ